MAQLWLVYSHADIKFEYWCIQTTCNRTAPGGLGKIEKCISVWLEIVVNHFFHCGKSVDNPLNWKIKKENCKHALRYGDKYQKNELKTVASGDPDIKGRKNVLIFVK